MNINITGRKTVIKDSFREAAEKQLAKFDRLFDEDATAHITVSNEKNRETVEITIRSGGMIFRGEKTTEDRINSLDLAVDMLFKQIVKNRGKLEKKFKQPAPEFFPEEEAVLEEDFRVIKTKQFTVKPMAVDEAILQMELLGHSFYVFVNGDNGNINVVYRRNDGDYGLIEPEL